MAKHVVTARIYTGGLYFLCLATSGKLGGWCTDVLKALAFDEESGAGMVFDRICSHLQNPLARNNFDPDMLTSLRKVALLVEFGVGHVEDKSVIHRRRKVVDISVPTAIRCSVIKLSSAV